MTPLLTYLVFSVILTFVLIMIPAAIALRRNGGPTQAGPRDNLPEPSIFQKRAQRLSANMQENMILFIPLVLIAEISGKTDDMVMLGAQIFFYARIIHAIIYLAGWPVVRPLAWLAGVVGMILITIGLF